MERLFPVLRALVFGIVLVPLAALAAPSRHGNAGSAKTMVSQASGCEEVSLADGESVRLRTFPGYVLRRQGRVIVLAANGKDRVIGKPEGLDIAHWPAVLACDLDGDGVPEFFILQRATAEDSLYSLVHLKHGVKQQNYLFSDRPVTFFANPFVHAEKRTVTNRTAAGYTETYIWKKPQKAHDVHYRFAASSAPKRPLSPKEQEMARFFDNQGRLVQAAQPLLSMRASPTFMPGALPVDGLALARTQKRWHEGPLAAGTGISPWRLSDDKRWIFIHPYGRDYPSGWVPVAALFLEVKESGTLRTLPDHEAPARIDDPLPVGTPVLIVGIKEELPMWLEVLTATGVSGWVPAEGLRLVGE